MDDFSNITETQEMIEYCKVSMAMPIINVELMDMHFRLAITDAALEFAKYNNMDATFQEYCILNLEAGTSFYPVSACRSIIEGGVPVTNVQSVTDIQLSTGLDNINALFSPSHILLIENGSLMQNTGNAFGPIINQQGNSAPLSQYTTAIQYLKQVTEMFGKSLAIKYIAGKKILQTSPTPSTGGPCIVQLMRSINENEMYNFPSFRKLALSRCLIIYARVLLKYNGTLPDGLTLNGDAVRTEGKELYAEALAEIKSETAPVDFFIF